MFPFLTDSDSLKFRWTVMETNLALPHMAATGVSGIDIYKWTDQAGVYPLGTVVDLTATAPVSTFRRWYGDVPSGHETDNPLTVTMDQPRTLTPEFKREWVFSDSTPPTITDGYWVLKLSKPSGAAANEYALGTGSGSTNAYVSGGGCLDLTDVEVVAGIRLITVAAAAFRYADMLTSVVFPNTVTTIGSSAFESANALTSVVLPSGLLEISNMSFYSCGALKTVSPLLPDTVTVVGGSAFNRCYALEGDLVIGNTASATTLGSGAFRGTLLVQADLSRVTTIGDFAFQECGVLTNVVLSTALHSIGALAFQDCLLLKTVSPLLPDAMTSLGYTAFNHCYKLGGKLVINNSTIQTLNEFVFNGTAITEAEITQVKIISQYAFVNCQQF